MEEWFFKWKSFNKFAGTAYSSIHLGSRSFKRKMRRRFYTKKSCKGQTCFILNKIFVDVGNVTLPENPSQNSHILHICRKIATFLQNSKETYSCCYKNCSSRLLTMYKLCTQYEKYKKQKKTSKIHTMQIIIKMRKTWRKTRKTYLLDLKGHFFNKFHRFVGKLFINCFRYWHSMESVLYICMFDTLIHKLLFYSRIHNVNEHFSLYIYILS